MTRKKVKLAFITDNTARKSTYIRRKKGIIKKVSELSTLCGVPACAIISSPFDDSKVEVWPNAEEAEKVIERYNKDASSALNQSRNVSQESFIMQRIVKAKNELKKQRQENDENEMTLSMFQYMQDGDQNQLPNTVEELKKLYNLIEKNMKEIENKLVHGCT